MLSLTCLVLCLAADPSSARRIELTIDGTAREALVESPTSKSEKSPLVFQFHGHGGSMKQAHDRMPIHKHWPEAVVVYMQGLPTPGQLTDPQGLRNGWQKTPGDQKDRDLKFFDAMLAQIKKDFSIDEKRIYSTGHSNGGAFTYLLWATRGDQFAAMAPSAAIASPLFAGKLTPKPVLHLAGEKDELVKFQWQKTMITHLKKMNECESEGKSTGKYLTEFASKTGNPVQVYIHPGGHNYPQESLEVITQFFKKHSKK